jgi:hypothetical protein
VIEINFAADTHARSDKNQSWGRRRLSGNYAERARMMRYSDFHHEKWAARKLIKRDDQSFAHFRPLELSQHTGCCSAFIWVIGSSERAWVGTKSLDSVHADRRAIITTGCFVSLPQNWVTNSVHNSSYHPGHASKLNERHKGQHTHKVRS